MTKITITQSQKRFNESVGALFKQSIDQNEISCLIIKSSSDVGVMRNGGRNGARFAPQSFLGNFKKLAQNSWTKNYVFAEYEVADQDAEIKDFDQSQSEETRKIRNLLSSSPKARVLHLGGGHDHIYPLLKAYGETHKKIIVINIDAHADTRTDETHHSGTPFRQFADEFSGDFRLFQIGLHSYSNSFSTLSPFKNGTFEILWSQDCDEQNLELYFSKMKSLITSETLVIFSLDADALSAHEIPGVSAVNPAGLSRQQLLKIWKRYLALNLGHPPITGIYELNPIYDTLAGLSMRTMASFVFESLE